jgi:hypothetical protein
MRRGKLFADRTHAASSGAVPASSRADRTIRSCLCLSFRSAHLRLDLRCFLLLRPGRGPCIRDGLFKAG